MAVSKQMFYIKRLTIRSQKFETALRKRKTTALRVSPNPIKRDRYGPMMEEKVFAGNSLGFLVARLEIGQQDYRSPTLAALNFTKMDGSNFQVILILKGNNLNVFNSKSTSLRKMSRAREEGRMI